MMIGRVQAGEFGFSLNPFHYVKAAASDVAKLAKNPALVAAASQAANAYSPGSGSAITSAAGTINSLSPGGGAPVTAPVSPGSPAATVGPGGGGGGGGGSGGGDDGSGGGDDGKILGMPKKVAYIGGAVLGAVVLLSLLKR